MLLPRHLEIIYEINRRLLDDVRDPLPGRRGARRAREPDRRRREHKHVRMANLAIVGSHSTNGVAAIHSELLRTTTVKDLAEMFPERFNNKTNGVTPRRWLLLANPALASTITEAIGDGWITDLSQIEQAEAARRRYRAFATTSAAPSAQAKLRFVDWLKAKTGQTVDPDTIFDCQIKRIHEYKRQLLNALRIVVLYNRLRENPNLDDASAHILLRRQGRARLSAGQAHHQVHQQPGRHDRRRSRRRAAGSRSSSCPSTASRSPSG